MSGKDAERVLMGGSSRFQYIDLSSKIKIEAGKRRDNMIKSHKFRGRKFKIFFRSPSNRNHIGTCDEESREIEIKPTLCGEEELDCLIHESLHACFPDLSDFAVNESATSIAKLLIKLNYGRRK